MGHKIELAITFVAVLGTAFIQDAIGKIVITVLGMAIGTIISHYIKKYLKNEDKQ